MSKYLINAAVPMYTNNTLWLCAKLENETGFSVMESLIYTKTAM